MLALGARATVMDWLVGGAGADPPTRAGGGGAPARHPTVSTSPGSVPVCS